MLCAKLKIKKCFARQFEISLDRVWALQLQNGKMHHFHVAFGFYVACYKSDRTYVSFYNNIYIYIVYYRNLTLLLFSNDKNIL